MIGRGVLLLVINVLTPVIALAWASTTDRNVIRSLQSLLDNKRYIELNRALTQVALPVEDDHFFRGVMENRLNHTEQSLRLLEPLEKMLSKGRPTHREEQVLLTLADDYTKTFQYAEAENSLAALLKRYKSSLGRYKGRDVNDRLGEMRLLRQSPPQTLEPSGAFTLPSRRNGLGLVEVPVEVNGKVEWWVLDTGAGSCVVTKTTADRIGLELLKGTATTRGATGLSVSFQIGVIPTMKIGSAILHNVELPVTSDENLKLAGVQIEGIIGFPVQAALGGITFYSDGKVGVNTEPPGKATSDLFLENQGPLIAVGTEGNDHLFILDTGATETKFSKQFYSIVRSRNKNSGIVRITQSAAGGLRSFRGYSFSNIQLSLGGQLAVIEKAAVYANSTRSGIDDFYGAIGQDVLRSFDYYSIDFNRMKFTAHK